MKIVKILLKIANSKLFRWAFPFVLPFIAFVSVGAGFRDLSMVILGVGIVTWVVVFAFDGYKIEDKEVIDIK